MARLTQMIEYLNASPKALQKQKQSNLYTHLKLNEKTQSARTFYRKQTGLRK